MRFKMRGLFVLTAMFVGATLFGQVPEGFSSKTREGWYENKGQIKQTDGQAAPFVSHLLERGSAKIFLLKPGGIAYQFERMHYPEGYEALMREKFLDPDKMQERDELAQQIRRETYRMDMYLEGANPNARIETEGRSTDYVQYYNHNVLDVHHYEKVVYQEVYPHIDWVVYTTEEGMKYDFVVRPGGNPAQIKLRFQDQEELYLTQAGELVHGNRMGRFTEQRPVSFQGSAEVASAFVLEGNVLSFQLGSYDKSKVLVIDPNRIWGTYYGGGDLDRGYSCSVDASGNVYLAGETQSNNAIAANGHQNTYGGGGDAFLVKFNSSGVRQWATYYGGNGDDDGNSCAIDGSGNVYLAGYTYSTTAIASGGHQNTSGGPADAFLVKFNTSGVRQWGTFYGGNNNDLGHSCAVDGSGNVYLAGYTGSTTAIASGGHQNTFGGGFDAFLVKFNSSGVRQWGTYYGGVTLDEGNSCAVDGSGNVYLAGQAYSTVAIAANGHQNTFGGGISDAFLVKFNTDGVRQWGTYYGGTGDDRGFSCATDASGNVYLAGDTRSATAIASGGHQNTFGGGSDGFLVKFNGAGVRQWGTYYGGGTANGGSSCVVDASGNVYLAGTTNSPNAIAANGHQNTFGGGTFDAFLVKFNTSGVRQWGTYYGGGDYDTGYSCALDGSGNVYLAGYTYSTTAIASGGHQNTFGGGIQPDAFLVKFVGSIPPPTVTCPSNITTNVIAGGCSQTVTFSATATGTGVALSYSPASGASFAVGTTTVTVTATDVINQTATCTFTVTVADNQAPSITCPSNISANTAAGTCARVVTFAATATDNCGSATVSYSPASGSTFSLGSTTVTATATDGSGNMATCTFTVTVLDNQAPTISCPSNISANTAVGTCTAVVTFAATATDNCGSATVSYSPASGSTFSLGTTTVTATATDAAGNTATCTFTVTVLDNQAPAITCPSNISANTAAGTCTAVVTFAATATDNCGSATVSYSPASGSTFSLGATTVTATATDAAGNTATCGFTVTVVDNQAPAIACPTNLTANTAGGTCTAVVTFAATATDNCGSASVSYSPASGSTFSLGATTVTATATDAAGNTATCAFTVTVVDNQSPTITCPADISVMLGAGQATAVVTFSATTTDNCSATVSYSPASGSIFSFGATTVTATAADAAGNTVTCYFQVTVSEDTLVSIACPGDIAVSTAAGQCVAAVTFAAATTGMGVTLSYSPASGSTFNLGATTVTATATDAGGNTATCSFTVTVVDNQAPTITCPAAISAVAGAGQTTAVVTFAATATDNCSATVSYSPASGSTFNLGSTTVTATATDAAGNTATCLFQVTVSEDTLLSVNFPDNIAVEASAPIATVYPNPTTGAFTLSFDREVTGFVQVFDAQGRLVASKQLNGTNQAPFDLGTMATGMYLLRIMDAETVITKQIVVARP